MRKFAHKQTNRQTDKQTEISKTEATLILCGSSGERANFQTQRENSFHYAAPRLFNRLPQNLRDDRNSTLDEWKIKLDKILTKVPDEPIATDLTPGLCKYFHSKPTNSLFHWMAHLDLNSRR